MVALVDEAVQLAHEAQRKTSKLKEFQVSYELSQNSYSNSCIIYCVWLAQGERLNRKNISKIFCDIFIITYTFLALLKKIHITYRYCRNFHVGNFFPKR